MGKISVNPAWKPPDDPLFVSLLERAIEDNVLVYFAAVPLARVVRYDPAFRPERTENGDAVVQAIMNDWRSGNFQKVWVYPSGDSFIVSDDYFTLAAAERGQPDFLPCWILGRPPEGTVQNLQGPISSTEVRKLLGVA